MMALITGGSGSGKSLFAEQMAVQFRTEYLYYLATMQIYDDECRNRILRHQKQRAGKGFITIETPFCLSDHLHQMQSSGTALLECVSNLLANLQFDSDQQDPVTFITKEILQIRQHLQHLIIVTNDIFADRIPDSPEMQAYLQNLGKINCFLAEKSDLVIEINAGIPVIWKGKRL